MTSNCSSAANGTSRAKRRREKKSGDILKAKEDEYRRLNAELEVKTSELVKEATQLLEGNQSIISNIVAVENDSGESSLDKEEHYKQVCRNSRGGGKKPAGFLDARSTHSKTDGTAVSRLQKRPTSILATHADNWTLARERRPHTVQDGALQASEKLLDSSAPEVDTDFAAAVRRLEMTAVSDRGGGGDEVRMRQTHDVKYEDMLPPAMEDMGTEATIRFLKAKLRVMQEEMDSFCQQYSTKDKLITVQEAKIKELEAANTKLQRGIQTTSGQAAKYKKSTEELKLKSDGLEGQLNSLRKEYDTLKLSQRKCSGQQSAMDVRLNRAVEEAEKYKVALQGARSEAKESVKAVRLKVDSLSGENRRLEKQKSELMTAFKKQMRLIDILKRQKMHIEAAKMLSFTEDEFVKALEWGQD